jgi:hypothetical protein
LADRDRGRQGEELTNAKAHLAAVYPWCLPGDGAVGPLERQAKVAAVGGMFDHDRPPSSLITLLANDHQIHPTEGMDRQGDGHALRREVLTWCSLIGSSG